MSNNANIMSPGRRSVLNGLAGLGGLVLGGSAFAQSNDNNPLSGLSNLFRGKSGDDANGASNSTAMKGRAEIRMPGGVDLPRFKKLDEGRMTKIYLQMLRNSDTEADKSMFPADMAKLVDVTPFGLTRLFSDTVIQSRRFEVYDQRSTVTAEESDYIVDGQIILANQVLKPSEGGMRVAETTVLLSLQMKNIYTGKYMLGRGVQVEGRTGASTGDRAVIMPGEDMNSAGVRQKLTGDYQRALRRAFLGAGQRLESILRPLGRVLSVDGSSIDLVGGANHGIQDDDEFVVFRSKVVRLGDEEMLASIKPVAVVHVTGAGTVSSTCKVVQLSLDETLQPQEGDYAVITDASLRKTRWE